MKNHQTLQRRKLMAGQGMKLAWWKNERREEKNIDARKLNWKKKLDKSKRKEKWIIEEWEKIRLS